MQLSEEFIKHCKDRIGKSRQYLVSEAKDHSFYNSEWGLMVPEGLFAITNQGMCHILCNHLCQRNQ